MTIKGSALFIAPSSFCRGASAVDLFCGVGGLTHGICHEGIRVVAGLDVDPECEYPYSHNNQSQFLNKNVADLKAMELSALYPAGDLRILVGCAPCQAFSKLTRGKKTHQHDAKWQLVRSFSRLIDEVRPDIVSMENVPQLARHDTFVEFVGKLEALGYKVSCKEVYCPDYGVPQRRSRLVLLASKLGPIALIPATHSPDKYPTVKSAIGDLSPLDAGGASQLDDLHRSQKLTAINLQRIKSSKPGGSWRDWDESLRTKCHQRDSGATYPAVYGRIEWNSPSPTITTQFFGYGTGRFGHPEQDRALSLREGALLQSFPAHYQFVKPNCKVRFNVVGRLIGNAVPPKLGMAIGRTIRQHIDAYRYANQTSN